MDDGTEQDSIILERASNSRGMMLMTDDPHNWIDANESFISYPTGLSEAEPWFTKYHSHDIGAIATGFYQLLPIRMLKMLKNWTNSLAPVS